MRKRVVLHGLLCVSLCAAVACVPCRSQEQQAPDEVPTKAASAEVDEAVGSLVSQVRLLNQIAEALEHEPRLRGCTVRVEGYSPGPRGGAMKFTAELPGVARSEAQRRLALSIARQKAPGFAIINHVRVAPGARPRSNPVVTVPAIKTALSANRALDGTRIDVEARVTGTRDAGMVVLRGRVFNRSQSLLAQAIAKHEAPGARIVNRLHVVPAHKAASGAQLEDRAPAAASRVPQPYASGSRRGRR